MRAAVYYNNKDVRVQEMPVPRIGPGELLFKVMASGICGSDVMEWYRIKKAPLVLGHEVAGVVAEVGEGITNFAVGDRIVVSHHVPCNTCRYCLSGNHTACHTLHTTNFDPGGFAEYVRVPRLNVDRGILRLPAEVSFEEGSFVEPLGCVVRAQRVARLQPAQTVLVLGSGISGLIHVQLARALGAGRIIATDVNAYRMEAARRLGADIVLDAREDVPARLRQVNDGRGADLVIICASAMAAYQQALKSVEPGGTVQFFAPTNPGVELGIPVNDFWRNSITLLPSYGAAPADLEIALDSIRFRRVNVGAMITHRIRLDEIQQGFNLVAEAKESIKVIVEPQRT